MTVPTICRLPDVAVSQLRSSVNITSLASCLQQLLMNSFDASATTIDININLTRNSLEITDDGGGILPSDIVFICQRYCTSKSLDGRTFGYHGETLASLAAHAGLSVTSRHRSYKSTHTVRYHYGDLMQRGQVTKDALMMQGHGTVVKVDRLWGNMPVRLKSREAVGVEKEWAAITRVVTELAVLRDVKIVVRDETGRRRVGITPGRTGGKARHLDVLKQVSSEVPPEDEWETVTATHCSLRVSGIVCLSPSASKFQQFIFLNSRPVAYTSTSLLYAVINQYFSTSTFGQLVDENTRPSRQRATKGIERHPLFVLNIFTDAEQVMAEEVESEQGGVVQDIISLLQKMLDEFLKVGGWRSGKKTQEREKVALHTTALFVGPEQTPRPPKNFSLWSRTKSSHLQPANSKRKTSNSASPQPPSNLFASRTVSTVIDAEETSLTNPTTDQTILLNSRTGNVLIDRTTSSPKTRISLPPDRSQPAPNVNTDTWTATLFQSYTNPVFAALEAPIPTCSSAYHHPNPHSCNDTSTVPQYSRKISKTDIQNARIISQVDNKYILAVLPPSNMLIIIDQHAADERIRVEALWEEACSPSAKSVELRRPIVFNPTDQERSLFGRHTAAFESWGIRYSMTNTSIEITALPAAVLDRCTEQSPLAIGLLRSYARELEESGAPPIITPSTWIQRLHQAPKTLVDMINSRACRGAIMFNDSLTKEECVELVRRLGECNFPFMCAHGRPSLVPLVDFGQGEEEEEEEERLGRERFVDWLESDD